MSYANHGALVAEAWDRAMTLGSPEWSDDLWARMRHRPTQARLWDGRRYWNLWNFRIGAREWRTADEAPSPRPAPRREIPWRTQYRLRLARVRSSRVLGA